MPERRLGIDLASSWARSASGTIRDRVAKPRAQAPLPITSVAGDAPRVGTAAQQRARKLRSSPRSSSLSSSRDSGRPSADMGRLRSFTMEQSDASLRQRRDDRHNGPDNQRRKRERQCKRRARCPSAPQQDQRRADGERVEGEHPPPGRVVEPFGRGSEPEKNVIDTANRKTAVSSKAMMKVAMRNGVISAWCRCRPYGPVQCR